jgi:hypothetical protein
MAWSSGAPTIACRADVRQLRVRWSSLTSRRRYEGGFRTEPARLAFFTNFGVAYKRGPSVRFNPLYSAHQRSYSACRTPTERSASPTGSPSAVRASIVWSLWTISLGLSRDLNIATPERRSTPQASDRA